MAQRNLFDEPADEAGGSILTRARALPITDGELWLLENWLPVAEQEALQQILYRELAWEQPHIQLFGKRHRIPRLNAWYGDPGCHYGYSGHRLPLLSWHPALEALRQRLQQGGLAVNSVLANWYRDGNDSNGWHSDDERELGRNPLIVSLSLGEARSFHLRHKQKREPNRQLLLPSGSLLIMAGSMQHYWQHALPKTRRPCGDRLNLTFRYVIPQAGDYSES
ncbi:alpha-ketoglutarate-dependent dioxygenase AlkB [Pseudomaricurvus sp. HS19]|uniref:alpha-ketoglutarate-dependent dioxygenase AlkB family protein n=1 Tax=Pseudomaricurvus sp. HS19 TaxID=2692626 RepID=UPI001370F07D|nr:alpha-ketoglutarate-dependent dioxygenase AlkB [Pseudomaricurvus sp. HS19]MYM62694.1 alpha-ketoglutarate-dependent dioxygenase AlkB [Pseudomaricurvus sp. HS19]